MTAAILRRTSLLIVLTAMSGCSEYSNSTPWGSTVADARTIEDVRTGIAVLENTSPTELKDLSEKTSRRETSYTGVRIKSKGSDAYEFFCWLPCRNQEVLRGIEPLPRPELIRITSEQPKARVVLEEWFVKTRGMQRRYQVRYFYVPGGGGETWIDAVFSRKPDHVHVARVQ
jgi:hypothetical protein